MLQRAWRVKCSKKAVIRARKSEVSLIEKGFLFLCGTESEFRADMFCQSFRG